MNATHHEVARAITEGASVFPNVENIDEMRRLVSFLVAIRSQLTADGLDRLVRLQEVIYQKSESISRGNL